ncbi:MAG TPA: hypothetical protein ENJ00_12250 [Phycisphaerales bacterium]|nr:hypothetical protein [Phycisphaerales bacterium]
MLQWLTSNIQIVVVILMVLGPSIGGVVKWLAQQQKILKEKQKLNRRREEELRTGRPATEAEPDPQILARKQAELLRRQQAEAELKRQQAEVLAERARRAQQARQAAEARRAPNQADATGVEFTPGAFAPPPEISAPIPPAVVSRRSAARTESALTRTRVAKAASNVATVRAPTTPILGSVGITDLRQAVVLSEILSPPVALRESHLS